MVTPFEPEFARGVYHLYVIRVLDGKNQRHLSEARYRLGNSLPSALHLQPAYGQLGYRKGDLPATEEAAVEIVSLPMYAELLDEQVESIARRVREAS